jgi:hypothetical protein
MKKIGEMLSKKIDRRIEEVIKVSAPEGADLSEYEKGCLIEDISAEVRRAICR